MILAIDNNYSPFILQACAQWFKEEADKESAENVRLVFQKLNSLSNVPHFFSHTAVLP